MRVFTVSEIFGNSQVKCMEGQKISIMNICFYPPYGYVTLIY